MNFYFSGYVKAELSFSYLLIRQRILFKTFSIAEKIYNELNNTTNKKTRFDNTFYMHWFIKPYTGNEY